MNIIYKDEKSFSSILSDILKLYSKGRRQNVSVVCSSLEYIIPDKVEMRRDYAFLYYKENNNHLIYMNVNLVRKFSFYGGIDNWKSFADWLVNKCKSENMKYEVVNRMPDYLYKKSDDESISSESISEDVYKPSQEEELPDSNYSFSSKRKRRRRKRKSDG
jgi:hypothetical protein